MIIARQSTARTVMVGPILDADGVAVTDGVVGDFKISKNGGAPAALNASATLTHRNTGHYSLALTASDLDTVGQAEIVIDDTTNACPVKEISVIEEAVYDALFAASATGALPVSSGGIAAAAFAAGAIDAAAIANGAIDAATFAADVDAEILSYLVDDATRIDASALNTATGTTIPAILDDTDLIDDGTSGLAKIATDVAAVLVDTGTTLDTKLNTAQADLDILTGTDGVTLATSQANYAPLKPTTAGRTLDVTATGAAGIDWGNVENPTTTVGLSGTTVKTATDVEADTNELQTDWENGGRLDLLIDAILADTGTDGVVISAATANAIADALLDRSAGVETNRTPRQALCLMLAALVGKLSGAATTNVLIRDTNDSKNRIDATVDSSGNRTSVTLDAT
jgi:hypothetical protein